MSSLEISCWILLLFVFSRNVVKKSVYFCFFFTKMTSNFGGNPEEKSRLSRIENAGARFQFESFSFFNIKFLEEYITPNIYRIIISFFPFPPLFCGREGSDQFMRLLYE